jgi:hypothetical protein
MTGGICSGLARTDNALGCMNTCGKLRVSNAIEAKRRDSNAFAHLRGTTGGMCVQMKTHSRTNITTRILNTTFCEVGYLSHTVCTAVSQLVVCQDRQARAAAGGSVEHAAAESMKPKAADTIYPGWTREG